MRRLMILAGMLAMASMTTGCPESKTPGPTPPSSAAPTPTGSAPPSGSTAPAATGKPSAAPAAALKGGWTLHVSSFNDSLPPVEEPPEKAAKRWYDHLAKVDGGKLVVEHKTLKKSQPMADADGAAFEASILGADWKKLAADVKAAGTGEGGTTFQFVLTRGEDKITIATDQPKKFPLLKDLTEKLKQAAGAP